MTSVIDAVYRDGVFRPATPPDLPEGTAVRLTFSETTPAPQAPDTADVLARILASAAKYNPATDNPHVTSRNVDEILYGSPDGAR